jgi:hypothetical protein
MTLGEARDLEMPEVAHDVENLLYGQPFQIPAQFAFTGRAISTLVGVSTGLAPEFNFVDVATPYARKFLGLDAEGAGQTLQQIFAQLLETGRTLLALPGRLEQVISRLETGQIEVKLAGFSPSNNGGGRRGHRRRGNNNGLAAAATAGTGNLALGFVFLGALAGGIVLTMAHQVIPGWFCLGLAGLSVLGLLFRR